MPTETLWQLDTCEQISTALSRQPVVRALWLNGSLAWDRADPYSDIDLVALIAHASLDDAAATIKQVLAAAHPLVLFRNRGDEHHRLLNFVAEDWTRVDVNIYTAAAIHQSHLSGLRTLFDKDGLDLPIGHGEPPKTDVPAEQVDFVVSEFIRVLGLLPVVIHRDDLVGAVSGSGLLRELLITLLRYEQTGQIRMGALNETKSLSPGAASALLALPTLRAEKSTILEFNRACWDVFIRLGPPIVQRYQAEWPTRLVEAVRARLARDLDLELG